MSQALGHLIPLNSPGPLSTMCGPQLRGEETEEGDWGCQVGIQAGLVPKAQAVVWGTRPYSLPKWAPGFLLQIQVSPV